MAQRDLDTDTDTETDQDRRARHLRVLRQIIELGMIMANYAVAQAGAQAVAQAGAQAIAQAGTQATGTPKPTAKTPDPTLAFTRATTVVRHAIALEARIASGDPGSSAGVAASRAPREPLRSERTRHPSLSADPRHAPLRKALHKLADAEPDRTTRSELRRLVDQCIDEALQTAPAEDLSLGDAFASICDDLGFRPDPAKLPDELLPGRPIPRTIYPQPGSKPPDR